MGRLSDPLICDFSPFSFYFFSFTRRGPSQVLDFSFDFNELHHESDCIDVLTSTPTKAVVVNY